MTARRIIPVALADRSYEVHVGAGLIDEAGALIKPLLNRPHAVIVSDETVAGLHGDRLQDALKKAGIESEILALKPGEQTKCFAVLESLCAELLDRGVERKDPVIALGGGVIGDLVGFAASILRRGVPFIQIPTTLLAQVDSSVGGKTAINVPQGKNLIGAFHQPRLVIADTGLLKTLDPRELRAGYAEVVKYGLLGDAAFFDWLEQNGPAMLAGDEDAILHAVSRSVEMKAEIVAEDEREAGKRALLNLGHTFGHALEAETGYSSRLLHGEGVAIGLKLAAMTSARLGLIPDSDVARIEAHLKAADMKSRVGDIEGAPFDTTRLMHHVGQDKKVEAGQLTFVLLNAIGDAFTSRDVEPRLAQTIFEDDQQ